MIVDDPCYFNFHALLKAHRAKVIGVPYTPSGPDLEYFAKALTEHHPRLYITNSALHNPTGAVLSPVIAHRLLKLAEQYNVTIIEDDIFADFEHEPAPRLAAFDGLDRVVHIGSFSKSLSASVRCGFIAARRDWIDGLVDLRIATSFGGGRLAAELVLCMLTDGTYRKHMDGLRTRLARSMGETSSKLKSLGLTPWIEPAGGMFLWCRLPGDADAAAVAQHALAERVVFAPGNVFSQSQSANSYMRFQRCAMYRSPHFRGSANRSCINLDCSRHFLDRQDSTPVARGQRDLQHLVESKGQLRSPKPIRRIEIKNAVPQREAFRLGGFAGEVCQS